MVKKQNNFYIFNSIITYKLIKILNLSFIIWLVCNQITERYSIEIKETIGVLKDFISVITNRFTIFSNLLLYYSLTIKTWDYGFVFKI